MEDKVVELSKTKTRLIFFGSLLFVALGSYFLTLDRDAFESLRRFNSPTLVYGIGLISILFFGAVGLFAFKKLFDKAPGLVINSEGLIDNSSAVSLGVMPWADISSVDQMEIMGQKFICIFFEDPQKYLGRGNFLQKRVHHMNMAMCGTPATISANTLQADFPYLYCSIKTAFENYSSK